LLEKFTEEMVISMGYVNKIQFMKETMALSFLKGVLKHVEITTQFGGR